MSYTPGTDINTYSNFTPEVSRVRAPLVGTMLP